MRRLLVTFFYLGALPAAPGTWGSLGAAGVYLLAWLAWRHSGVHAVWLHLLAGGGVVLAGVVTVTLGPWMERTWAKKDPAACVTDEVAGQWLALVGLPIGVEAGPVLGVVGLQFVLFRLLDITKPPPARRLEALPQGWGVLLDDLAVAVYANLVGQVVFRVVWRVAG